MNTPNFSYDEKNAILHCLNIIAFCDEIDCQRTPVDDNLLALTSEINYINSIAKEIAFVDFSLNQIVKEYNGDSSLKEKIARTITNFNSDQKKWFIERVFALVFIDGYMNQDERETINDIFGYMNISEEIIQDVAGINKQRKSDLDMADICFRNGNSKIELKDFEGAISEYDEAIKLNPKHKVAHFNRGFTNYCLKHYVEAIVDFDTFIESNPWDLKAHYQRGLTKKELGDNEGAIYDFDKAIEISVTELNVNNDTENPSIYFYQKGLAKYNLQAFTDAIINFDAAIRLNCNYFSAYFSRGAVKCILQRYSEGIEDFNMAITLNPCDACSYYQRGLAKINLKDEIGAKTDFNRAVELDPQIMT